MAAKGVEKGGTTALFNFMIRHPHVMPKLKAGKDGPDSEVLFLGEQWNRGGSKEDSKHRAERYQAMFQKPPAGKAGTSTAPTLLPCYTCAHATTLVTSGQRN